MLYPLIYTKIEDTNVRKLLIYINTLFFSIIIMKTESTYTEKN